MDSRAGAIMATALRHVPDDDHASAWRWIAEHLYEYPARRPAEPLKLPPYAERPKPLLGWAMLTTPGAPGGDPLPAEVQVFDGSALWRLDATPGGHQSAELARALFRHAWRSHMFVSVDGARWDYHLLLRHHAPSWIEDGYTIHPVAATADLRALVIGRGRTRWWLCDLRAISGMRDVAISALEGAYAPGVSASSPPAVRVWHIVGGYAAQLAEDVGVALRPTLGRIAINAAARTLPADDRVWRPTALAVTLCRAAGGYRGAYVYARRHRGPAWRVDMRRAYLWAMSGALPIGAVLSRATGGAGERDGMWLCTVQGPGAMPAYIPVWAGDRDGFSVEHWTGERCVAVLASAEMAGLRALGYRIYPSLGVRWRCEWTMAPFRVLLETALVRRGADTVRGTALKLLGNAAYGKLAERPDRVEATFAAARPSAEHRQYLSATGDEVPNLWARRVERHTNAQHVDSAAVITARVRGRLYEAAATCIRAGMSVLYADTDALILDADPAGVLDVASGAVGEWRSQGYDADAVIAGERRYAFGNEAHIAGARVRSRAVVEWLQRGEDVVLRGRRISPGWLPGEIRREASAAFRAG